MTWSHREWSGHGRKVEAAEKGRKEQREGVKAKGRLGWEPLQCPGLLSSWAGEAGLLEIVPGKAPTSQRPFPAHSPVGIQPYVQLSFQPEPKVTGGWPW